MLNTRQTELLKIIVEEYTKTARAVGSKSICEKLKCSSATVRHEMSILEELGMLEKAHISSGRIPSESGTRYYVDNIMNLKEITGEDMLKLQQIFNNNSLALSDAIIRSMEIVSDITNYTAIVLGSASKDNRITKVEVVPVDQNNLIAIIVTDKKHVEHKNIHLDELISIQEIKQTVDLINRFIVGTKLDEVSQKLEFEVKPKISDYLKEQRLIYDAFYTMFNDFQHEKNVNITNPSNLISNPEFNDVNKVKNILSKFEDKEFINSIEEEDNGIKIYIGSESDFDDDIAVIKSKYSTDEDEGTIALVGPKRMDYERVTSLMNYIINNLNK